MSVTAGNQLTALRLRLTHFARDRGAVLVTFFLFALGAFAIFKMLHSVTLHDISKQLHQVPIMSFMTAALTTLCGYVALIGYDWSALRIVGKSPPFPVVAVGSFTAYALSNSIGLAIVSGGAVRYRFYHALGLSLADIAIVSTYCALAFGLGVTIIGFGALAFHPSALSLIIPLDPTYVRLIAVTVLMTAVSVSAWSSWSQRSITIGRFRLSMPGPRLVAFQVLFSFLDIVFGAITLYVLLPDTATSANSFGSFMAIFAAAQVAAILSHVPGGVGVFEAVILSSQAAGRADIVAVAAALVAYRTIYYFLPLLAGVAILIGAEVHDRTLNEAKAALATGTVAAALRRMIPSVAAASSALVLLAGAMLVLNGIIPTSRELATELTPVVPLELFELSNVVIGAIGGMLIILAIGLRRRIRAAFWLVLALLALSVLSLLIQRLDFDLVVYLALLASALWLSRAQYYRQSWLTVRAMSVEWLCVVGAFLVFLVLFLLFAHKDVEYTRSLWWQFAFDANMPRALRVAGVSIFASLMISIFLALRPAARRQKLDDLPSHETLRSIIARQDRSDANLAFTGDKRFLVSDKADAFIMYARRDRSFVSLGAPVGNCIAAEGLIHRFTDLAEAYNCCPVFFPVSAEDCATFFDAGFICRELGEEAVVDLSAFALHGSGYSEMHETYNHGQRFGFELEIVAPPHNVPLLETLRTISVEWLAGKEAFERGFLCGRFDTGYLQYFRLALVRHRGAVVAFANIMETDTKSCVSLDLMRHSPGTPESAIDFLLDSVMLSLKSEGVRRFSLGIAPTSELAKLGHSRPFDEITASIFCRRGQLNNFERFRECCDKFSPEWRPRYLVSWAP